MMPAKFQKWLAAAGLMVVSIHAALTVRAFEESHSQADDGASAIRIIAEPKSSRPFEWKRGEKVTIGVRLKSENGTRVVGVASDVELVATKSFDNRIEMMLRAERKVIKRILQAAKISEYWFEVMPFDKRHVELLKNEMRIDDFLTQNKEYRPANAEDWGYGAAEGRLAPPTASEVPVR